MTGREAVAETADLRRANLPGVNERCTLFTLKSERPRHLQCPGGSDRRTWIRGPKAMIYDTRNPSACKPPRDGSCSIYIMTIRDLGFSKVGISRDPKSRLGQLLTGSPFKIELFFTVTAPDTAWARWVETGFHKINKSRRRNGEWFDMTAEEATLSVLTGVIRIIAEYQGDDEAARLVRPVVPDVVFNQLFDTIQGGVLQ